MPKAKISSAGGLATTAGVGSLPAAEPDLFAGLWAAIDGHDDIYAQHPLAVTLLLTELLLPYLRDLYKAFDGDLTMAVVLGEIGQANVRRLVNAIHPDAVPLELADASTGQEVIRGCNSLSVSHASGIARETTRRKIKELEALGWITPHPNGGWMATSAATGRFTPEFNRDLSRRLLETALRIAQLGSDSPLQ